jgi:hypothetical protein
MTLFLLYKIILQDIPSFSGEGQIIQNKENGTHIGDPFDKLGMIDFEKIDKDYIEKTQLAVKWIRDVDENWKKWSVNPPTRKELYPNMCVESGKYQREKEKIALQIGDITSIYYYGVKNRDNALSSGIKSWKDNDVRVLLWELMGLVLIL